MKTLIPSALVISVLAMAVLGASAANAAPRHHRHKVCAMHHHHRVCHWV